MLGLGKGDREIRERLVLVESELRQLKLEMADVTDRVYRWMKKAQTAASHDRGEHSTSTAEDTAHPSDARLDPVSRRIWQRRNRRPNGEFAEHRARGQDGPGAS